MAQLEAARTPRDGLPSFSDIARAVATAVRTYLRPLRSLSLAVTIAPGLTIS